MNILYKSLSQLYGSVAEIKNIFYDKEYFEVIRLNAKVISVGNLTVGGTGKTPVCQYLLNYFRDKNISAIVVAKSYKAELDHAEKVDIQHPRCAAYYGDEISMIAELNPDVSCYSGPTKWQTALLAVEKEGPQCIILDDGFQHRKLHRDRDFVLMDATDALQIYEPLPLGRAREGLQSLARASMVILTKANLVPESKIESIKKIIPKNISIVTMNYSLEMNTLLSGKNILAVSGIAKPQIWYQMLKDLNPKEIRHREYSDHYAFTQLDIDTIEKELIAYGCDGICVTEKDWVKIKHLWSSEIPCWVTKLKITPNQNSDLFHRALDLIYEAPHI